MMEAAEVLILPPKDTSSYLETACVHFIYTINIILEVHSGQTEVQTPWTDRMFDIHLHMPLPRKREVLWTSTSTLLESDVA